MHIDIMSMSAHKVYGPKGIGALYRRRSNPRVLLEPIIYGGGHEKGIRSGSLNVPGIVGFGEALAIAREEMDKENVRFRTWTYNMFDRLRVELGNVELNGHPTQRLAHNLNIYLPGIESRALIVQLPDVAIATGSACTSASVNPSHVIVALGFEPCRAYGSIRISVGRQNTTGEIQRTAKHIIGIVGSLRTIAAT